jgi:large subunit ribosomal protein L47
MRSIKHALTERFYAWEDAVKLAKDDPEVDLSGEGNAYTPMEHLEADLFEDGDGTREARDEHKSLGDHEGEKTAKVDPSALSSSKSPQARPEV